MDRSTSTERRLMLSFAVFGVYWGGWGALLPEIKENVNATEASLGVALLFIALGAIIGMTAAGRLYDRFGTRLLAPAHVFFALATIPPALASRPVQLIPTLVLLGMSTGLLDVVINGATATYESRSGRGLMGKVHAMFSLGVLLAGVSVGAARDGGLSEVAILAPIAALVLAGAFVTGRVSLPLSHDPKIPTPRMTMGVFVLGALCGLAFLIEDGMLSWSAIHLEQTLNGSATIGGLGPTCLASAMVAGRALTDRISARFEDRTVIGASGLIGAAGATITAMSPNTLVALIGIIITGAGISVCAPLIFSVAGRYGGPGRQGAAISRVTTIAYVGFIIGPPLVGGIAGVAGLRVGIGAMAVLALALAAGSMLVPASTGTSDQLGSVEG
jgi:MFS family permease